MKRIALAPLLLLPLLTLPLSVWAAPSPAPAKAPGRTSPEKPVPDRPTPAREPPSLTVPAGWDPAKADPAQKEKLERIRASLEANPSFVLHSMGFTDGFGSPEENAFIAFFYAREVARKTAPLLKLKPSRVELHGEGEKTPVVPRGSFVQQSPNRRVVLTAAPPGGIPEARTAEPGKKVLVLEPASGRTDRAYQKLRALVEGGGKTALLTVNGLSRILAVQEARVEADLVLEKGINRVEVMAWDDLGAFGKDAVTLEYEPPPPRVTITTPRDGESFDTTEWPVVPVQGRMLSEAALLEAFIFLNGEPRRIEVRKDGSFSQPVVLDRKDNLLRVEAVDVFGKVAASGEIQVRSITLDPKDLVVSLTWDKPGVDLDLHVWGPENRHSFHGALDRFESPEAIEGGEINLDDKDGFGPEVFSLSEGKPGLYTVGARYYHSSTGELCHAVITVVLHPAEPARRIIRSFGPFPMGPGPQANWEAVRVRMPEGNFLNP